MQVDFRGRRHAGLSPEWSIGLIGIDGGDVVLTMLHCILPFISVSWAAHSTGCWKLTLLYSVSQAMRLACLPAFGPLRLELFPGFDRHLRALLAPTRTVAGNPFASGTLGNAAYSAWSWNQSSTV